MREWLKERAIEIPVKGVIVFTSTKSKIVKPPHQIDVIYATSIPVYLRNLYKQSEDMSVDQLDALAERIMQFHQSYLPYPMCKIWGIDSADLITGVQCLKCGRLGMERIKRTWLCPACNYKDSKAHFNTINEWFVLVGEQLSNTECRRFLQIHQHQTASRMLQQMGLIKVGERKSTKYKMNEKMLYGQKNFYVDRKEIIRS